MTQHINPTRRSFLGGTAVGLGAVAEFALTGGARARAPERAAATAASAGTPPAASFGAIRQIDAGLLNIGYAEIGSASGPVVVLLHGWPYDIHSFVEVAPLLAAAGYRVIVPYLRGYGSTRMH